MNPVSVHIKSLEDIQGDIILQYNFYWYFFLNTHFRCYTWHLQVSCQTAQGKRWAIHAFKTISTNPLNKFLLSQIKSSNTRPEPNGNTKNLHWWWGVPKRATLGVQGRICLFLLRKTVKHGDKGPQVAQKHLRSWLVCLSPKICEFERPCTLLLIITCHDMIHGT